MGHLSGEASTNTLVNLFASRALPESYAINDRASENPQTEQPDEQLTLGEAFADT
jgi:hypothetical protein